MDGVVECEDRRRRLSGDGDVTEPKRPRKEDEWVEKENRKRVEPDSKLALLGKAGGAYIPPAKLKLLQQQLACDKSSEEYQRINFQRLKKKINGCVNKVNISNIANVVTELLQENVVRGSGVLAQAIIQAQTFSPTFSNVYAALVAIINSKFPSIGQLILKRLVIQFKRGFRLNNKGLCLTVIKFIAHLTNQRVAHEILVLEILFLLMEQPTDDSIELTITLLKECGEFLTKASPKGTYSVFERLRNILEDADTISTRTQYMIERLMLVRKEQFKAYPAVIEELDLIEEEDQISHMVELITEEKKALDPETGLNYFKYDPEFEKNEEAYEEIRKKIIGDGDDSSDEEEDEEEGEQAQEEPAQQKIVDMTDSDIVAFRRSVYLCIQSSLDYQEAAHKLIKFHLKPGLDEEMCNMIVDCCAQQRTYEKFYGLLSERFCRLRLEFQRAFEKIARDTYKIIHRFEVKKIRIMAQLVSHLLATDAIEWSVLSDVKMNDTDTTSAGRVYIKVMFQELAEAMGHINLYKKLYDPTLVHYFEGLFPLDHPKNTRFAINFFTLSGLGGLTIRLREQYEKMQKKLKKKEEGSNSEASSSDSSSSDLSSDSSSDSDSSDSDSSSSSDSSSDSENDKMKKKNKKHDESKSQKQSEVKKEIKEEPFDEDDIREMNKRREIQTGDRRAPDEGRRRDADENIRRRDKEDNRRRDEDRSRREREERRRRRDRSRSQEKQRKRRSRSSE